VTINKPVWDMIKDVMVVYQKPLIHSYKPSVTEKIVNIKTVNITDSKNYVCSTKSNKPKINGLSTTTALELSLQPQ